MIIGAMARIGMVCEAMIHGIRLRSSARDMHDADGEQRCRAPCRRRSRAASRRASPRHGRRGCGFDWRSPQDTCLRRSSPTTWCGAGSVGSVLRQRRRDELRACSASRPPRRSRSRWNGAFSSTAATYQMTTIASDDDQHRHDAAVARASASRRGAGAGPARRRRCGRRALSPHSCAPPAAPRARGGRSRGIPASRGCRAGAPPAASMSMTSVMRPGRGDITTIRVDRIHRLGDRMGDEARSVLSRPRPELQQLLVELVAHDLVERAERLVHQQQVGIEGQRAGDRGALLHAARQLPGILLARSR